MKYTSINKIMIFSLLFLIFLLIHISVLSKDMTYEIVEKKIVSMSSLINESLSLSQDQRSLAYVSSHKYGEWNINIDGVYKKVIKHVNEKSPILSICYPGGMTYALPYGFGYSLSKPGLVKTGEVTVSYTYCSTNKKRRDALFISPGGKHISYLANNNGFWSVFMDKNEVGKHRHTPGKIVFSSDGQRYAYTVEGKLFVDGIKSNRIDENEFVTNFLFSPDSQRFAYSKIRHLDDKQYEVSVIIDNSEGKKYKFPSTWYPRVNLIFSLNSKRFSYSIWDDDKGFFVVDGIEHEEYGSVSSPVISLDSSYFAYRARKDKSIFSKSVMVIEGNESKEYDSVSKIVFSPNGNRFAYSATENEEKIVIVDGKETRRFNKSNDIQFMFSLNGQRLAYSASGKIFLDGVPLKEDNASASPHFSPDGKLLTYIAERPNKNHKEFLFIKYTIKKESKGLWEKVISYFTKNPFEYTYYNKYCCYGPHFSSNSKRIAYLTLNSVVVDGIEGKKYESLLDKTLPDIDKYKRIYRFSFSPNNKHFVYTAKQNKKRIVVLDGNEILEYDKILTNGEFFSFDSNNELNFLAQRGEDLYLTKIKSLY